MALVQNKQVALKFVVGLWQLQPYESRQMDLYTVPMQDQCSHKATYAANCLSGDKQTFGHQPDTQKGLHSC